jgi:hypothetical protein
MAGVAAIHAIANTPAMHRRFDTAPPRLLLSFLFNGDSFIQIVCAFLYRRDALRSA